jgi:hypothetical protein
MRLLFLHNVFFGDIGTLVGPCTNAALETMHVSRTLFDIKGFTGTDALGEQHLCLVDLCTLVASPKLDA